MRTVATLFVASGGPYSRVGYIDFWDEPRDARRYMGPHPVIAHPPCARWGRYWGGSPTQNVRLKRGDDAGCFLSALTSVRRFGGVLEHPKDSYAWEHFGLAKPPRIGGWVRADNYGFTCCVDQEFYGHRAQKGTWLYVVGVPEVELPVLQWGKGVSKISLDDGYHSAEERARKRKWATKKGVLQRLSKRERAETPDQFRDLLLGIARKARTP